MKATWVFFLVVFVSVDHLNEIWKPFRVFIVENWNKFLKLINSKLKAVLINYIFIIEKRFFMTKIDYLKRGNVFCIWKFDEYFFIKILIVKTTWVMLQNRNSMTMHQWLTYHTHIENSCGDVVSQASILQLYNITSTWSIML